jgi:hypothetical protein
MDNQFDATEVERPQMCLNVINEENIYCPALRVGVLQGQGLRGRAGRADWAYTQPLRSSGRNTRPN